MAPASKECDVLIVGAGPTGLLLSACLSRWGYSIEQIDIRSSTTQAGRADGIQPRTLDILFNLGLESKIAARNPGKFGTVAFWDPTTDGEGTSISRTGAWPSCPEEVGARHPYTTTLHQGLIEQILVNDAQQNRTIVRRPWSFTFDNTPDLKHSTTSGHTIDVKLRDEINKEAIQVKTKYLIGADGPKSQVRTTLGIPMRQEKDPNAKSWGALDARIETNFPDIEVIDSKAITHTSSSLKLSAAQM